jgi:hypothetical protein
VSAASSQTGGGVEISQTRDLVIAPVVAEGAVSAPVRSAPAGYAPTYYPGVTAVADALAITVGLQAEAADVDFGLQLVPTVRVSGTVTAPDGSPVTGGSVTLSLEDGTNSPRFLGSDYGSGIRPDGTFMIANVPPGRYTAFARVQDRRTQNQLFGFQNVSVAGADVTGVGLSVTPGQSVSGTVMVEPGSSPVSSLTRVRVALSRLPSLPIPTPTPPAALPDGSFSVTPVVAGTYLVSAAGLPQNFALKAVFYGDRDVTDQPLLIRPGQNITGLTVVISDRVTELTGAVTDSTGQPLFDCVVVAFSTDVAMWRPLTRYIRVGLPGADHRYRIRGLAPGEYWVAAVDDVENGEWYDPTFLESVKQGAVRVSLADGASKSLDLKLATVGR